MIKKYVGVDEDGHFVTTTKNVVSSIQFKK